MDQSAFWSQVDQEIARHDLLGHPFYQAWSRGELTRQDLRFYGEQYYHQVSAFPTYLTTLHARLPEGAMRRDVLANAHEEECQGCAHSELWRRFVEGIGGAASSPDGAAPSAEVGRLVETFRDLARESPVASVFGALYAYESQVPRIAAEKLDGLKRHYGADDRTCSYFALHRTADIHHANVWRASITTLIDADESQAAEAFDGVSRGARALWSALDGIERDRPGRN